MSERVNILIVDDRRENLVALENLLDDPDIRVVAAQSGNEALQRVLETEVALVLLDVQMPEMDGYETAELMRINPRTRGIPIIFVTATSGERQHIFKGYEAGAVDYITKPIEPMILRSKVQVFCQLWRQREELAARRRELAQANEVLADKNLRLEKELALARKVQLGFLPSAFPMPSRIHFAHSYQICTTLGGDLFDVFRVDADRIGLYVADVSGHGVNAALISGLLKMAMENEKARARLEDSAAMPLRDPAALLAHLAGSLPGVLPEEVFITMGYAVIELSRRRVMISSAGHPYPVYVRQSGGHPELVRIENGPALGFSAGASYEHRVLDLDPGDILIFYTDGITEAMNSQGDEFGEGAFLASVGRHVAEPLPELLNGVLADISAHRGGEAINDDCTMVALQLGK